MHGPAMEHNQTHQQISIYSVQILELADEQRTDQKQKRKKSVSSWFCGRKSSLSSSSLSSSEPPPFKTESSMKHIKTKEAPK